jgi:small subunit ribosomal protein S1
MATIPPPTGYRPRTPGAPTPPPPGAGAPPRPAGAVAVGRIVDVEVTLVGDQEVEVRLADGRTGVVPRREFPEAPAPGATVSAALLARDDPRGRVVLSHAWAAKQQAWDRVEQAKADATPLRGRATKVVKGGLVVDVGLRAFLPASLVGEQPGTDPAVLVGTDVDVLVTEVDRSGDRIVVSRRDLLRRERRRQEKEVLSSLEPGSRARGTVVNVADYGAVVDLGGVRGLVHRSELTWQRFESVADVVAVGDEVEVEVLDVNRSKRRVSLSMRRTSDDPYDGLEVGQVLAATVTRVVDYGAFMRLDDSGAEGLVHMSELADVPGYRPDQLVAPGEQVMVKVLEIDRSRRRLALSVRRVLVDD